MTPTQEKQVKQDIAQTTRAKNRRKAFEKKDSSSEATFRSYKPTAFGAFFECPIYGDERGLIVLVDGVAYITDIYDPPTLEEQDYYQSAARKGELTKWEG